MKWIAKQEKRQLKYVQDFLAAITVKAKFNEHPSQSII